MTSDFEIAGAFEARLLEELRAIAPELHLAPPRRGRRRRRTRAALIALVPLLAAGTALAATGAWEPILGNDQAGHPTRSRSALPADLTAALGVLRRPQVAADRGPDVEATLRI